VVERGRRVGDLSRLLGLETYVWDHLSVTLETDPCPFHFTVGAEPGKQQISPLGDPSLRLEEVLTDCSPSALALWPRNNISAIPTKPH